MKLPPTFLSPDIMRTATQIKRLALLMVLCFADFAAARDISAGSNLTSLVERRELFLVEAPPTTLEYHNGPILTGVNNTIPVYLIWYGPFNETVRTAVHDFLESFQDPKGNDVSRWWTATGGFKDSNGKSVAQSVKLAGEMNDTDFSMGKIKLTMEDMQKIVMHSLSKFPANAEAIYFIISSADVHLNKFCMNSCSSHTSTKASNTTKGLILPFAWVGNPVNQCPGMCAWPFAQPDYMPSNHDMVIPPNGDMAADAIIIQLAYMLAGTATNPFSNAYYQGDASVPMEAGTACYGFGAGAYSGYPGTLQKDNTTGAQYNAHGINDRKFLLPTLWNPDTRQCDPLVTSS